MKLVFATANPNKLDEVRNAVGEHIQILNLNDINCTEDIPETSPTIEGNAMQKAVYVFEKYGYNCFADDTGLEVEALNNEPGVLSARYAGEAKNSDANKNKLLKNLKDKTNRNARFKTVIALIINGQKYSFGGIVRGKILEKKTGEGGFGYDPIFRPDGFEKSFAQMSQEEKNRISHRGIAVRKLVDFLKTNI